MNKYINFLDLGDQLTGTLLLVDALDLSFRKVKIAKDSMCPLCGFNKTP